MTSRIKSVRRPRFSLRVLLVAISALCGLCAWLGYQRNLVVERRAMLESWKADPTVVRVFAADDVARAWNLVGGKSRRPPATAPWIRRVLGDEPIQRISFRGADPAKVQRAVRYFPEAAVSSDGVPVAGGL